MPTLHPAIERLLHSGQYACRANVEGFTEHELKDKTGKVIRKVTRSDLEAIAKVNNQKAANGALTPIGPGHTFDDSYDANGQLVNKFPEEKQPKPFGYLYNYRVELNPHTHKYSLIHDEYIQKLVHDPETGKMVDGMQYSASFPRRSAEVYHDEHWMDWMAAIRRAPRLDLGLSLYAKHDPDHTLYSRAADGSEAPVIVMARNKSRYSFDTGGSDMADPNGAPASPPADPTAPPDAKPAGPAAPEAQPGAGELPPLHKEAADKYAHHASGMHPSRFKHLMGHLHQKYAAECGMPGDMNTEYAMPGPTNVPPGGAGGGPPSPSAPPAPATPASPPKPEPTRMQQDQAAIEKDRYEKRFADLEARAATAEAAELKTYYERQLLQLVYEGYEVDTEHEMKFCGDRRYSRQQFDDHIGILRRMPHAPISNGAPLDPEGVHRPLKISSEAETQSEKYAKNFDAIQRGIRQGKTEAEAFEGACGEKYKGSNGVLSR